MSAEVSGPVILREKPAIRLVDLPAYAIPDEPTRADLFGAAAWVERRGGQVKVCDVEGLLVVSTYSDGGRYHEWIEGESLLTYNPETREFSCYGPGMVDSYAVETDTSEATS